MSQIKTTILLTVFFTILLPISLGGFLNILFPIKFVSIPLHSILEASGGIVAIIISMVLYLKYFSRSVVTHFNWATVALLTMGIIDIFHAAVIPGKMFVWLHSSSVFFGGIFFMSVWIKEMHVSRSIYKKIPLFFVVFPIVFSLLSISFPHLVPEMLNTDKTFTTTANVLNIIGGLGFFIASIKFVLHYIKTQEIEEILFAGHTMLFGVAGILFVSSVVWDMQWWLWHVLRLTAYLIALYFLFIEYRKDINLIESNNEKLEIANNRINEYLNTLDEQLEKQKQALNAHSIVAITNTAGTITFINKKFEEISGYSKNELVGNNHRVLNSGFHSKEFWKEMYEKISNGKVWKGVICNLSKSKKRYWVDTTIFPFMDKKNKPESYIAIRTDVTRAKELELELINSKQRLEKALKSKSEFLANMSHEIRTPLNAIMGFIDLLKDENKSERCKSYLDIIDSSSEILLKSINDILDISKIESGKLAIDKVNFDTRREFSTIVSLFNVRSSEKNIHLILDINDNLPQIIHTDLLRIKQIIVNLLSNAIKFSPEGGDVIVSINFNNTLLNISVQDKGKGIAKDKLSHIFEVFSQEDSSTTREYGGTGLGLSISSQLVKLLGGKLNVNSELEVGSEFYFSIPVEIIIKELKETDNFKDLTFEGHKILLVEDNKPNQLFMQAILKKLDLAFDIASDGLEAVEIFKLHKYDAILMDENMPNMNGIAATKNILALEKEKGLVHTPIIALTANALKNDKERFLEAGMDEYLTKPINKEILSKTLNKIL